MEIHFDSFSDLNGRILTREIPREPLHTQGLGLIMSIYSEIIGGCRELCVTSQGNAAYSRHPPRVTLTKGPFIDIFSIRNIVCEIIEQSQPWRWRKMTNGRDDQGERLIRLLKEITRTLARRLPGGIHPGLTMPQLLTLHELARSGPMSLTELSRALALANSTVSGIIDRLERAGHVRRQTDPDDQRIVRVELAKDIQAGNWQLSGDFRAYTGDLLSNFDPDEVAAALGFLDRFLSLARQHEGGSPANLDH